MTPRMFIVASLMVAGCAGGAGTADFDSMTAAEHRAAAEHHHRVADQQFARARGARGPASPAGISDVAGGPYYGPAFYDPAWDPGEPEHYIVDERVRVPGEDDGDSAAKHRAKAERHEAAAEGVPPGPRFE